MASFATHSWELPPPPSAHAWEADEGGGDEAGNWGDEAFDGEVDEAEYAATQLLEFLMDLFLASTISARALCLICYW